MVFLTKEKLQQLFILISSSTMKPQIYIQRTTSSLASLLMSLSWLAFTRLGTKSAQIHSISHNNALEVSSPIFD